MIGNKMNEPWEPEELIDLHQDVLKQIALLDALSETFLQELHEWRVIAQSLSPINR